MNFLNSPYADIVIVVAGIILIIEGVEVLTKEKSYVQKVSQKIPQGKIVMAILFFIAGGYLLITTLLKYIEFNL